MSATAPNGRRIIIGGYGRSAGWDKFNNYPLDDAVNNEGWFDDAGDGPVSAVLFLSDGRKLQVQGSAWVCATDPSYTPQIKNVVSLWEDMFNAWVRQLRLAPDMFDGTSYNTNYKPGFYNQLSGIFEGAKLQQWIANLPQSGTSSHNTVGGFTPDSPPSQYYFNVIRNPNDESQFDTYALENRWPDSLFWKRRKNTLNSTLLQNQMPDPGHILKMN